jgi:biotin synthase
MQREVQRSTLLSIKTGGCSEDCGYCSQSARHDTGLEKERLLPVDEVLANARAAKARAPAASAWAPPGAARRTRTSPRCSRWCAR